MTSRFVCRTFLSMKCLGSNTTSQICLLPSTWPFLSMVRFRKHWNPKFKKERAAKVIKVTLPDYDEKRRDEKLSVAELRAKLKEKGIAPTREWEEKPLYIDCSSDIFDAYIPPEGDGKLSPLSSSGIKQKYEVMEKKGKSYLALRKIRNIDYEFDVPTVAEIVKNIYIQAQKALVEKDEDKLHELVTEKAFPEMMENVKHKTLVWNFIQCLEPPHIVHVRMQELMSRVNKFAQVTLKLHSQQTLAIYDRFGRLMHGSEDTVKDVLEYVVFEKYITNPNGTWRLHGKIIPDWLPPRDEIKKTYQKPDLDEVYPEPPEPEKPEEGKTPTEHKEEGATLATT